MTTASRPPGALPTQAEVLAWVEARWPDMTSPVWRAMKVGEEAGEVLGAVVKGQIGLKPPSALVTETAQLVVCAMALAESAGFDLNAAVAAEWESCATRVWTPDPVDNDRSGGVS